MESGGKEKASVGVFRGFRAKGPNIGRKRKGYKSQDSRSSSASSSYYSNTSETDASEGPSKRTNSCQKSLDEAHVCLESDEGFSTTASEYQEDTSDEDVEVVGKEVPPKTKKRRKTFLSRRRKRIVRKIGSLNINDGIESESENESSTSHSDDDGNNDNKQDPDGKDKNNANLCEQEEMEKLRDPSYYSDLCDFDVDSVSPPFASPLSGTAQTTESNSNVSAIQSSQTLEPISVGTGRAASVDSDVLSFSSPSHLSEATQAESDSNVPVIQFTQTSEPIDSGLPNKSSVEPDVSSFSSPSHLSGATQAESDTNVPLVQCTQTSEPIDSGLPNKSSVEPDAFVSKLLEKLKFLLPTHLQLEILDGSLLRIMKLNSSRNAFVQSCVYYDHKNKSVGLFVNGMPIPNENKVFDCQTVPNSTDIGSLADYLCELVTRVGQFKVCKGIHDHEELWETSRGFLDYSSSVEEPCFRNAECLFLIPSGKSEICFGCRAQVQKFERELKRRETEIEDSSKLRDKDLSKEGMKARKDKYRNLYKLEKKRTDRLQRRVDSLQIRLDEVLKDELSSILRLNQHKMTPLQKLFWESQMKILSLSDKRGMRWHPMLIRLALHLHSLSSAAYEFINECQFITLPSSRRLYDYSHFVQPSEGCQQELTDQIKEKIRKCGLEEHFKYVNLMFDEMHIRSGLVFSRSTGELIGYTQLSGVEEELKKMQEELNSKTYTPRLAKKVLVFMAQGITSDIKDVVAVYSTDDLSASQLYDKTWEVIYHLEESDIRVLTLTFDGASVNRKFVQMHERLDRSFNYCYSTKNLAAGSRPLFFILDPPHLIKTIRNAFANSFSHKGNRKLWKNGQFLSWKVLETLFEMTKDQKYRGHKLTKAHVKLTSFSVMTVLLATQTLSNSVANCIEEWSSHESMKMFDTSELVQFIRLMNKFFDCVNGKDESGEGNNPDKFPFTSSNDERLSFLEDDFLQFFEQWKEDIRNRPGIFTTSDRNNMIISHQALGAMEVTVKGITGAIRYMLDEAGAPSVCARVFNQDPLEQYFSKVRRMQGDNRNPTLKAVLDTRMNLQAQGSFSAASQKGNTEAGKRKEVELDPSLLPSRKVPRKQTE